MKKTLALAISACALASTFAAPALATTTTTQNPAVHARSVAAPLDDGSGPGDVYSDPKVRPLSCRNQKIVYGWDGSPFTEEDWIGLYKGKPNKDNWEVNNIQWNWVVQDGDVVHEFDSGLRSGQNLYTVYWTKGDNGKWAIVDKEGPENKFCN
jgi:hypothetical protein